MTWPTWRSRWRRVRMWLWGLGILAGLTFPFWGRALHHRLHPH